MDVLKYDQFITNCIRHYTNKDIDDIKQDVYLKLLLKKTDYSKNINAYIFKTVRSIIYDRLRKKYLISQGTKQPVKRILINEEIIPEVSDVLYFHAIGYKYAEISEITGMSVGALRKKVFFERKKLKSCSCHHTGIKK